jgi:hypothetical protein
LRRHAAAQLLRAHGRGQRVPDAKIPCRCGVDASLFLEGNRSPADPKTLTRLSFIPWGRSSAGGELISHLIGPEGPSERKRTVRNGNTGEI